MNNLTTQIQSLFGIGEYTKKTNEVINVTKKVFFKAGKWSVIKCNVPTTFEADKGSIGSLLLGVGATLEFFQITEVTMTYSEFDKTFGFSPIEIKEDKTVISTEVAGLFSWVRLSTKGNVTIALGATVPEQYLTRIVQGAFKTTGSNKHVTPAHPRWVFGKDGINILVSNMKMPILNENLIRAGKDIWNKPEVDLASKEKSMKLLVLPSTGTIEGDGNFFVSKSAGNGYTGLVRGLYETNGELGIIKGRVLSTDMFLDMPDGSLLPEGVDGWITTDNIKWLSKSNLSSLVGTVINVTLLSGVQDEDHDIQEFGYKFHSLALILMKMDKETKERMEMDFRSFWKRSAEKMKTLSVEQMISTLKDETNGFVLSSQAVKCLKGVGTPSDRTSVLRSFAKKFLSLRIEGSEYPMIIFAKSFGGVDITPDSPVWSPELFKRLSRGGKVTEVTLSRYPLVSHQSYLRVELVNTVGYCDMGVDYVVLHPDCAKYIQGDGDDHALVQSKYLSSFRASSEEQVEVSKPQFRTGNVNESLAYFKGAKAQGSIGYAFNAMIKALVAKESKLAADAANAINAFAQGVKKDAILPEASEMASGQFFKAAVKENPTDFLINLAGLITSKNDPDKFAGFAATLGFDFGINFPIFDLKKEDKSYKSKVTNFVQAKNVMAEMTNDCAILAGFESFTDLRNTIRKEASLWSVEDFIKVSLFFLEYAKMAFTFRGFTHHRVSGLLASQLEGKYLAIYDLLARRI